MSKALITGITGMVGSHLADYLIEHTDWEIYGVCRWRSPLDNVEHLLDRVNRKDRIYFVMLAVLDSFCTPGYLKLTEVLLSLPPQELKACVMTPGFKSLLLLVKGKVLSFLRGSYEVVEAEAGLT